MEPRRFRYYFKLMRGGALRYGEGVTVEEAARDAGVQLSEVKRHMPIEALPTAAELEARQKRFEMLRQREKEND